MPVNFFNFEFSYLNQKGKPVYVPTKKGRRLGGEIKKSVERLHEFPAYFRHLRKGGHVAALHDHRRRKYFAKVDLKNFFYTVHRNRIQNCLHQIGVVPARTYAKWSTVKCPYDSNRYVLPYGFVQSPILATLVLDQSALGSHLRTALPEDVFVSIYIDDITISSNDEAALVDEFAALKALVEDSGFVLNEEKCTPPSSTLTVFNCLLRQSVSMVTDERSQEFYSSERSVESIQGFEMYRQAVAAGSEGAAKVDQKSAV